MWKYLLLIFIINESLSMNIKFRQKMGIPYEEYKKILQQAQSHDFGNEERNQYVQRFNNQQFENDQVDKNPRDDSAMNMLEQIQQQEQQLQEMKKIDFSSNLLNKNDPRFQKMTKNQKYYNKMEAKMKEICIQYQDEYDWLDQSLQESKNLTQEAFEMYSQSQLELQKDMQNKNLRYQVDKYKLDFDKFTLEQNYIIQSIDELDQENPQCVLEKQQQMKLNEIIEIGPDDEKGYYDGLFTQPRKQLVQEHINIDQNGNEIFKPASQNPFPQFRFMQQDIQYPDYSDDLYQKAQLIDNPDTPKPILSQEDFDNIFEQEKELRQMRQELYQERYQQYYEKQKVAQQQNDKLQPLNQKQDLLKKSPQYQPSQLPQTSQQQLASQAINKQVSFQPQQEQQVPQKLVQSLQPQQMSYEQALKIVQQHQDQDMMRQQQKQDKQQKEEEDIKEVKQELQDLEDKEIQKAQRRIQYGQPQDPQEREFIDEQISKMDQNESDNQYGIFKPYYETEPYEFDKEIEKQRKAQYKRKYEEMKLINANKLLFQNKPRQQQNNNFRFMEQDYLIEQANENMKNPEYVEDNIHVPESWRLQESDKKIRLAREAQYRRHYEEMNQRLGKLSPNFQQKSIADKIQIKNQQRAQKVNQFLQNYQNSHPNQNDFLPQINQNAKNYRFMEQDFLIDQANLNSQNPEYDDQTDRYQQESYKQLENDKRIQKARQAQYKRKYDEMFKKLSLNKDAQNNSESVQNDNLQNDAQIQRNENNFNTNDIHEQNGGLNDQNDIKTNDQNDIKTNDQNDIKTNDQNDIKTNDQNDIKTNDQNDIKSNDQNDIKTNDQNNIKLNDYNDIKTNDQNNIKTNDQNDIKTNDQNDIKTNDQNDIKKNQQNDIKTKDDLSQQQKNFRQQQIKQMKNLQNDVQNQSEQVKIIVQNKNDDENQFNQTNQLQATNSKQNNDFEQNLLSDQKVPEVKYNNTKVQDQNGKQMNNGQRNQSA